MYMENGVRYSGLADDIALWTRGKKVKEVKDRMQRALHKVDRRGRKKLGKSDQVTELPLHKKLGGEGNGFEDAGRGNPHKETSALFGGDY